MTIVGPGGIGKTTVALAVAEQSQGSYAGGTRFVELSQLAESKLVPIALASALELSITSDGPTGSIVQFLARKQMLIVLDTCEHVIDAAAVLAYELLRRAPGVHILATSREPLQAQGEWIQRLPPLETPLRLSTPDGAMALDLGMSRSLLKL